MSGKGRYGLLGERLGHSFSPAIHGKLADYEYSLFECKPEELDAFLRSGVFEGLNVTIPYKKAVIPYCKELTPQAQRIGSVNTIVRQADGSLLGHNTDYDGFSYLLHSAGADVTGKKVLVLGTGGASLTVRAVLQDMGAAQTVSISRTGPDNYENLDRHRDARVIVNATPVGMYPDTGVSPIDLDQFPALEGVFDLIYNPAKTQLLLDAERRGLLWNNGLGMLVAQAKAAAECFLGKAIPDERVEEITREMERSTRNLLLVGMPGSGKTTVGKRLAKELNRRFVDVDDLIKERIGACTIPEFFAREGEETFRQLEHELLCQVTRQSGLVIAPGGGAVTRAENLDPIRQNSTVIFLKRELWKLPVKGRAVTSPEEVRETYEKRLPFYEKAADITVYNGVLSETVAEIRRRLEL